MSLTPEELEDHRHTVAAYRGQKAKAEQLEAALSTARAELEDFRKAWSLLDEPGEKLRGAHSAEEAARQFLSRLSTARAEAASATADAGRLAEALRKLRDEQNGAPLTRRVSEWNAACAAADAALSAHTSGTALATHDAELLEKVARHFEGDKWAADAWSWTRPEIAHEIRQHALKEPKK